MMAQDLLRGKRNQTTVDFDIKNGTITIKNLVTADPEIVEYFEKLKEGLRQERFVSALRTGVIALKSGQTAENVDYVKKEFDDSARGEISDPSWELDVRWSPRTYSHFDFRAARYPSETNGGGNFVDNTSYSAEWEHEWSNRIKSRLGARYLEQDFRGSALNRKQELTKYGFSLSYEMRRWLSWKAGVEVNSRDSNINQLVFDGNVYSISVLTTL